MIRFARGPPKLITALRAPREFRTISQPCKNESTDRLIDFIGDGSSNKNIRVLQSLAVVASLFHCFIWFFSKYLYNLNIHFSIYILKKNTGTTVLLSSTVLNHHLYLLDDIPNAFGKYYDTIWHSK